MKSNTILKDRERIGNFIAEIRELKGFTQGSFAKALKTSQSAVARMESGQQNLTTEMLAKISAVLNHEIITLADKSVNFKIQGGHKLSGKVTVNSSKNAAVGLLCATLLNKGRTVLKNLPKIEEVNRVIEVLVSIGVSVKWQGPDVEISVPEKISINNIDKDAAVKTRSVLMLLGPLSHLLKEFSLPLAGGCKLGERTVRPHLFGLEKLGIHIKTYHDHYSVTSSSVKSPKGHLAGAATMPRSREALGGEVVLYEMGDTVTENVLMAAAKINGITTIKLASANYMVQDLCHFLQVLGVKIEGIGTSTLKIHGKAEINAKAVFNLSEDPIEAMLFLSLAATTNSSITIERCPIDFLELELLKLEKMGWKYKILKRYKSHNGVTNLIDIKTLPSKLVALEEKIHPQVSAAGINIDNLPFFVPVATQAKGTTLIHDWVYENRAIYYMELNKLRANIILADPHRVYVEGPSQLRAAEIICPPALRPAAIILITMLAAKGTSVLRNVYSINRGYENLVQRLQSLGANIETIHSL